MTTFRSCAAIAVAIAAASASGQVIMSNLNSVDGGGTLFGPIASTQFKAAGFVLNDDYFIDSVTLAITDPDLGADASVAIWEGVGSPQSLVANLLSPSFNGSGDYDFTPAGSLALDAGVQYWIYVDNNGEGDTYNWDSGDAFASGPGGAGNAYNFNGGSSSFLNRFAISGTLVPSPGAAAVIGLAGLAAVRRRR